MEKFYDKITNCLTTSFFCSLLVSSILYFSLDSLKIGNVILIILGVTGLMWIYNLVFILPLSYLKELILKKIRNKAEVFLSSLILGTLSFIAGLLVLLLLSRDIEWMFIFFLIPGTFSGMIYPIIERWDEKSVSQSRRQ
ncbi:hypothetical protein [Cohnella sp. JJ-181]|uniref:hypothetical protein n=1 Tax=Cohnella rhizoplanae TaxID=2974897 RepID=UPI00232AFEF0|nr:hypothetical protein [Cohnella sp. JJ-181]